MHERPQYFSSICCLAHNVVNANDTCSSRFLLHTRVCRKSTRFDSHTRTLCALLYLPVAISVSVPCNEFLAPLPPGVIISATYLMLHRMSSLSVCGVLHSSPQYFHANLHKSI